MGAFTVITPPKIEPVTLEEAKGSLKILHDDEDDRISALIKTGREYSESFCGIRIMTTIVELSFDYFPASSFGLSTAPLQKVDSVKYLSTGSPQTQITLTENVDYYADVTTQGGRLTAIGGWPSAARQPNSVKIRMTAGYIDASLVPEQIKDGIKAYIVYLYDTEESMLNTARSILWPQRIL